MTSTKSAYGIFARVMELRSPSAVSRKSCIGSIQLRSFSTNYLLGQQVSKKSSFVRPGLRIPRSRTPERYRYCFGSRTPRFALDVCPLSHFRTSFLYMHALNSSFRLLTLGHIAHCHSLLCMCSSHYCSLHHRHGALCHLQKCYRVPRDGHQHWSGDRGQDVRLHVDCGWV